MKLALAKVHENYTEAFTKVLEEQHKEYIKIADTGDYLQYGQVLYLLTLNDEGATNITTHIKELFYPKIEDGVTDILELYIL